MIIKRTSAKDELTKVVESELKDLYRYAFYRIGDREDAEDIIQDLYIALHGRIEKIGVSCNLRNYIYRALSNNCTLFLRKRIHNRAVSIESIKEIILDAEPTSLEEEFTFINSLLEKISDEQSEVIRLHIHGNRTFVEIAEILGIPVTTAKSRFKYGIEKLKREFEKQIINSTAYIMEKDFDSIDEKSRKIIELLTPKHFNHTMELKKTGRKHSAFTLWKHLTAAAAIIVITLFMGTKLLQPDSAYSMPATSKEILANAIKAIRELKSVSLEFNARIESVTPDYAECSSGGTPAKCRYRLIQDKEEIIQRLDFDFDSIKVSNIYVNDSVYIWQDKELLYKGVKESPTGLKSIVKIENVLKKISDCNDIKMEKGERVTTLKHETAIEGGTLVTVGTFDNRTGLLESCSNFFVYEGATFPIVESTKMEYNIPISKEEMLISP